MPNAAAQRARTETRIFFDAVKNLRAARAAENEADVEFHLGELEQIVRYSDSCAMREKSRAAMRGAMAPAYGPLPRIMF